MQQTNFTAPILLPPSRPVNTVKFTVSDEFSLRDMQFNLIIELSCFSVAVPLRSLNAEAHSRSLMT